MRKLASIRVISQVVEHTNAEKLGIYIIEGWQAIDQKNKYEVGDKVVYCEIDSFLPVKPEFEFLRKSSFRKMGVLDGFRLRTIRLRGELSQGLIMSMSVLGDDHSFDIGDDVSEFLGIVKYEPPIPEHLSGEVLGQFPGYIPKTDEERVQNLDYEWLKNHKYFVTEKLDGSSCTMFLSDDYFGVCSRNLELKETDGNAYWNAARRMDIENILKNKGRNLALQGELIGSKIQSNPYQINHTEFRLFKIYDIDKKQMLDVADMYDFASEHQIPIVPLISSDFSLPDTVGELLKMVDGPSELRKETIREGLVFIAKDTKDVHFKAISNLFLEGQE
jgi:RNA ligase (TIGR02306 family)